MNSETWDQAWKDAQEHRSEDQENEDVIVYTLARILIAQMRQSPASRRQTLAALAIAKAVIEL